MFCLFDLYLTADLVKTESILCLCVRDSDLIKRSSSGFHRWTPCVVILREGRCGAELSTKSWKSARKAVSSSARGGEGLQEGARGQLQGDVEDELCCGWEPRAERVPGQTEEPCILLLPVWGRRWVSRGSKVNTASFKARIKAGGDREVTGIHFSRCFCMYESFSCFPSVLKHNTSPQEFHCFYKVQQ